MEKTQIAKLAHFTIPDYVENLQTHVEQGIDAAIWLRFEIPADKEDAFLKGVGYSAPLGKEKRFIKNRQLKGVEWWNPDSYTDVSSGNILQEDEKPRYGSNILIVQQDEPTLTIFMFVTSL